MKWELIEVLARAIMFVHNKDLIVIKEPNCKASLYLDGKCLARGKSYKEIVTLLEVINIVLRGDNVDKERPKE